MQFSHEYDAAVSCGIWMNLGVQPQHFAKGPTNLENYPRKTKLWALL